MATEEWNKKIADLYDDKEILEKTWDCKLVHGKTVFKAHKGVLAAQSSELHRIFALLMAKKKERGSKSEETKAGTETGRSEDDEDYGGGEMEEDGSIAVHIPDVSFSVQAVEAIIHYCYRGYLDEAVLTGDGSESILELAHYYGMTDLEGVLEAYLAKSLNSGNVVRRAMLADECSAERLKKACVSCIVANNKSVFESSEWKDLMKKKLELAVELQTGVLFHDRSPALKCPSRKDMVEKRNGKIWLIISPAGTDIHDCCFKVGEKFTFTCHKCFLVAHSPILREMLTNPMAVEAETGVVHEKLFPVVEAVRALICYCTDGNYASKVGNETVATVFQLADKYLMDELKSAMEKRLVENLSTANVVEMVVLADAYSAQDLRKACVKLIARWKSVIDSAEWTKLRKENLNLVAELLKDALREKFAYC